MSKKYCFCTAVLFLLFFVIRPSYIFSEETAKQDNRILLHLTKGAVSGDKLSSYKLSSLFREFGYSVKNLKIIKKYRIEGDSGAQIEVYLFDVESERGDLLIFCGFLEKEREVILATPFEEPVKDNTI